MGVLAAFVMGCTNTPNGKDPKLPDTGTTNKETLEKNNLADFGKKYAQAWCSHKPENVAELYAENASASSNGRAPAIGREAIAKGARDFMTAFPDLALFMDSLATTSKGTTFHWTLMGTYTAPNGTVKKLHISGYDVWQLDEKGLIKQSASSFNEDEYNRQLTGN